MSEFDFEAERRRFPSWDGEVDDLRELFTYANDERWKLGHEGIVSTSPGIDREGRWNTIGTALVVPLRKGAPDTPKPRSSGALRTGLDHH